MPDKEVILYVAAQFAAMGASGAEIVAEVAKLTSDPQYLTEWAQATGYSK